MTAEDLDGRVALVSGGGTGIGKAIAAGLAEAGAAVTLTGRRAEVLERAAAEIAAAGGRVEISPGDVSVKSDCELTVERTLSAFGSLSILVNNAGVASPGPLSSAVEEDVHAMVDIDLKGPIFLTQAALPALQDAGGSGDAAILNISSSVTFQALEDYSIYSAAKAGLDMLTRCWAKELAASGVRVNAISPGIVETPVFETMMPREKIPAFLRGFDELVPLGRVGQPADVAGMAVFLCGPGSAWTTGAVIAVDGGLSLAG